MSTPGLPDRVDAGRFTAQVRQVRNLAWRLQEGQLAAKFLLRDRGCRSSSSTIRLIARRTHSTSIGT